MSASMLHRRTLLGGAAAAGASLMLPRAAEAQTVRDPSERPELNNVFTDQSLFGTFVLVDPAGTLIAAIERARAEARFVPASTFKVPNTLIALEIGVVRDADEVIPYGGKPQPFKQWERDMPMREALPASAVPIYQEIARRVGFDGYREWLAKLNYGNQELGTVVDRFWLDGPLAISAVENATFLLRLAQNKLPASDRAQEITRDICRLESRNGATLYGKTGWQFSRTPQLGWWVGWVERAGAAHAFALNMDMRGNEDGPRRIAIGKALLERLGVW